MRLIAGLACLLLLAPTPVCRAQAPTPAEEILRLVPDDMAFCLVVQDLRGYNEKFQKSPWYQILNQSALGSALFSSKEFGALAKFENEIAKHLGVTWAQLRDDIFGDAVAFAFRHGPKNEDEQGLVLLKARNPQLLAQLIGRVNREQEERGELKELREIDFKGGKYVRRVERHGEHYYALDGGFFAFSGKQEVLRRVLEVRAKERDGATVLAKMKRANATGAFAAVWVNPRAFDADLKRRLKEADEFETHGLKQFLALWDSLDAVVASFTPRDALELVVSVQAKDKDLSPEAQRLFNTVSKSSELWERFPDNALLAVAGHVDMPALAESLGNLAPPPLRKLIADSVHRSIESALELNLQKDVLPNVGPDWGVCISAAADGRDFPHVVAALAVRAGDKNVDQAFLRALNGFAAFARFSYNFQPGVEPIREEVMRQGDVQVHYLTHDKLFPRGWQPAFALKEGYLVIASSPEAVRQFRKGAGATSPTTEALCLRVSLTHISKLITQHRTTLAAFLAEKNRITPDAARDMVSGILAVLAPFDRLTVSERSGQGQISMILRLTAAK